MSPRILRRITQSLSARRAATEGADTRGHSNLFEIVIAILLGLAALATAWAAYRASLDDGDSIKSYNQSVSMTDQASQAYNEGTQALVQDQQVFLEYVKAIQADDEELAAYVRETLMSDDLVKGLEWWEEQPGDEHATPFVDENPSYTIAAYEEAAKLDEEAKRLFAKGKEFDDRGDRYTLVTVILAATLFLLGIASVTRVWVVKVGFMLIGTAFLIGSAVQLGRIYWG